MTRDALIAYCLDKPGAAETYPWGEGELVAKVGEKAFAFIDMDGTTVTVKCAPTAEQAAEWRQRYPDDITVSPHIGRYGWNRVQRAGAVPDTELRELVDGSYAAVVAKLPRAKRP